MNCGGTGFVAFRGKKRGKFVKLCRYGYENVLTLLYIRSGTRGQCGVLSHHFLVHVKPSLNGYLFVSGTEHSEEFFFCQHSDSQ